MRWVHHRLNGVQRLADGARNAWDLAAEVVDFLKPGAHQLLNLGTRYVEPQLSARVVVLHRGQLGAASGYHDLDDAMECIAGCRRIVHSRRQRFHGDINELPDPKVDVSPTA